MNFLQRLHRKLRSLTGVDLPNKTDAIIEGMNNQSLLLNGKLEALIDGLNNQSQLFNDKLEALVQGVANQSRLLNHGLEALNQGVANQSRLINEKSLEIIDHLKNHSWLFDTKLENLSAGVNKQTIRLDDKLDQTMELLKNHSSNAKLQELVEHTDRSQLSLAAAGSVDANHSTPPLTGIRTTDTGSFDNAKARLPLMIDVKTYNTSHPDYDAKAVRNFPGKIFNADKTCNNAVYMSLKQLALDGEVPDSAWRSILDAALEELKTVPHSCQVFERRAYIENYVKEIAARHEAHYAAGWVNLDDALFLYWLVRRLDPEVIVQTGVCNGLSSAFIMLGLVKNGSKGRLHVIDLPPVFNPADPAWIVKEKVYGVMIPEGKSSGWMVPDAYRDRFELCTGDAKELLPKLIDKLPAIDLFYHDSDHTYEHMMFEFEQAKRKLRPGGLIVGDDISWNASMWDFADKYNVPSFNFKGAVGVAFFPGIEIGEPSTQRVRPPDQRDGLSGSSQVA